MKLCLPLLLVALALCCPEANGIACPSLVAQEIEFLTLPESLYKLALKKYEAPEEAVAAKLEVKECADKIDYISRGLIVKTLAKILLKCGLKD